MAHARPPVGVRGGDPHRVGQRHAGGLRIGEPASELRERIVEEIVAIQRSVLVEARRGLHVPRVGHEGLIVRVEAVERGSRVQALLVHHHRERLDLEEELRLDEGDHLDRRAGGRAFRIDVAIADAPHVGEDRHVRHEHRRV